MKNDHVHKVLETYFATVPFKGKDLRIEQLIQFGALQGVADIVLQDSDNNYIAIVLCKQSWERQEPTILELKSYLSATDTQFGILATGNDPELWVFCENQRNNYFIEIPRDVFESRISKWHPNARDSAAIRALENNIQTLRKKVHQGQTRISNWRQLAITLGIVLILVCGVFLWHTLHGTWMKIFG